MQAADLVNIHMSSVSKILDTVDFALAGWRRLGKISHTFGVFFT